MAETENINQSLAQYALVTEDSSALTLSELEQQKKKNSIIDYKMVTFSLAGKDYAIDIMKVKEIAKAGRFTYVPNTLPFVLGVYNLRGEIIPIVDLRLFFNIDVPQREDNAIENMLIVNVGEQTFGVVVDDIDKVVGIQKSTIQPPHPLFGDINIKYIYGVVEADRHLYILLDVDCIFGAKSTEEIEQIEESRRQQLMADTVQAETGPQVAVPKASAPAAPRQSAQVAPAATETKRDDSEVDFQFVISSLRDFAKFNMSGVNESWVKSRFQEWTSSHKADNVQLQTESDAREFLSPFYSQFNGTWWSESYAKAVFQALPENPAKNIVVWNPGCGAGAESYSLACVLKKKYPQANIHIYAHDIDLLNVSNAPLLNVPVEVSADWYMPFLTQTVSKEWTFKKDIKDSIMFEYHDCVNTNALPPIDLVFARDLLSFLPNQAQEKIIQDCKENLKGNGIIILGKNEDLSSLGFKKSGTGEIKVFVK